MKLSEAIDLFCQAVIADGLTESTLGWYKRRLAPMRATLGDSDLETLKTSQLRDVLIAVRNETGTYADHPFRKPEAKPRSPVTIRSYTRAFRRLFNWLVGEGHLEQSPVYTIRIPRSSQRLPHAMDTDDLKRLHEVAQADPRDAALLALFCATGARVSGIVALRWCDVNIEAGEAMVIEKGNKERVVYLDDGAKQALNRYAIAYPRKPEDYLFPRLDGGHLRGDSAWHIFKRLAMKANIKGRFNPHAIRHAFARAYLMNGGDLKSLSLILGHQSVHVTAEYYANYEDSHLKEKHQRHAALSLHSQLEAL